MIVEVIVLLLIIANYSFLKLKLNSLFHKRYAGIPLFTSLTALILLLFFYSEKIYYGGLTWIGPAQSILDMTMVVISIREIILFVRKVK